MKGVLSKTGPTEKPDQGKCKMGRDLCPNGKCVSIPDGYTCTCNQGFRLGQQRKSCVGEFSGGLRHGPSIKKWFVLDFFLKFLKIGNCVLLIQTHAIVAQHYFWSLCEVTWHEFTPSVIVAGFCTAHLWPKSSSYSFTNFQNSHE